MSRNTEQVDACGASGGRIWCCVSPAPIPPAARGLPPTCGPSRRSAVTVSSRSRPSPHRTPAGCTRSHRCRRGWCGPRSPRCSVMPGPMPSRSACWPTPRSCAPSPRLWPGAGAARVVLDPVLRSTTGRTLLDDAGQRALIELLLPLADLITPNLPEAEALLGHPIRGIAGMKAAARQLLDLGPRAVLVKGGHRRGEAVDVFADAGETLVLSAPRIASVNTRGTGCVLSTACACFLAQELLLAGGGASCQDVRHRRHPPFVSARSRAGPREPDGRRAPRDRGGSRVNFSGLAGALAAAVDRHGRGGSGRRCAGRFRGCRRA